MPGTAFELLGMMMRRRWWANDTNSKFRLGCFGGFIHISSYFIHFQGSWMRSHLSTEAGRVSCQSLTCCDGVSMAGWYEPLESAGTLGSTSGMSRSSYDNLVLGCMHTMYLQQTVLRLAPALSKLKCSSWAGTILNNPAWKNMWAYINILLYLCIYIYLCVCESSEEMYNF